MKLKETVESSTLFYIQDGCKYDDCLFCRLQVSVEKMPIRDSKFRHLVLQYHLISFIRLSLNLSHSLTELCALNSKERIL